MNESGPIKRPEKTLDDIFDFSEYVNISPNIWRVTADGKYWLLKTAPADDAASGILLRREYELSRNLQHPFILSAFAYLKNTPAGPAIMMEYVEGSTLRDFAAQNPASSERKKVFCQILDAVEYIHRKGLLHNDIKPENIMVTSVGGDVKIIDFGFAENDADYLNKRLGGTAGASAPEIFVGDNGSASTAAADIFALGGILELLFPKKYRGISRRCHNADAGKRYSDVDSLRRAVARADRIPTIMTIAALLAVIACVSLVPDYVRRQEIRQEEESVEADVRKIQEDVDVFFRQTVDSLSDRSRIPYMEFASPIVSNFANRFSEYRKSVGSQELKNICDTIYTNRMEALYAIKSTIPRYGDLYEQGRISHQERDFYTNLRLNGKPYTPYKK